jgi:hypothetical protein
MISPYLYDFWPFLLLIFSPLETADFFMLLKPPGDGYSLLCSKKQPPQHNVLVQTNSSKSRFSVRINQRQADLFYFEAFFERRLATVGKMLTHQLYESKLLERLQVLHSREGCILRGLRNPS